MGAFSKRWQTGTASVISPRWPWWRCAAQGWRKDRGCVKHLRREENYVPEKVADGISQDGVLGSTGERVSAIGLGGWHLGLPTVNEQLSVRIVRSAVDRGINFM